MKDDAQLKSDVSAELAWDAAVNATRVGVSVARGVVTLSGQVETYLQKHAIERAVRRVSGVRGIALDLSVSIAPEHQRSDTDIARAALDILHWHSQVPEDRIKVEVEDGYVTLTGEVDTPYQLTQAERSIRPLTGIMGVSNRITLKPRADAQAIHQEIEAAFARHAQREARHIAVSVEGGVVTLRGNVDTLAERDAALGTARAAAGVVRVVDQIQVGD